MISLEDVQLYAYQMFKALSYLEVKKICHRDIKPQNILVNDSEEDKKLKICDFGSAKQLKEGASDVDCFYTTALTAFNIRREQHLLYLFKVLSRAWTYLQIGALHQRNRHVVDGYAMENELAGWLADLFEDVSGCVIAEMVLGEPLFPGENSLD